MIDGKLGPRPLPKKRKKAAVKREAGSKRVTGNQLNKEWGVGALHALYRSDGKFYHLLERFPGALFDPGGYVLFDTREAYENCVGLKIQSRVHVVDGISSLPSYVNRKA